MELRKRERMIAAGLYILRKSHVSQHYRHTASGQLSLIHDYWDKRFNHHEEKPQSDVAHVPVQGTADTKEDTKAKHEIPAGAQMKQVTYKIVKKGRKWFEAVVPGKGYKAQIEINPASEHFKEGEEITFNAGVVMESSKYGTSVKIYPVTEKEVKDKKNLEEIKRWLGYVEEKAPTGYLYEKGVQTLTSLGIKDHPELNERLIRAKKIAEITQLKGQARTSLGYIKDNISKYWYQNGETKVNSAIASLEKHGIDASNYKKELDDFRQKYKEGMQQKMQQTETGGYEGQTYKLHGGSGYGYTGWTPGQVIKNSKKKVEDGEPEYLYILHSDRKYVAEDGMSFGVGDEKGYTYTATARAATDEESAPLKAKLQRQEDVKQAKASLENISKQIRENGERPEGSNRPQGETVYLSKEGLLYGTGEWFVIGDDYIWFVRNNGMDGDNWSNNNVRTGGAGAIGWRVPFNEDLASNIRKEAKKIESDTALTKAMLNAGLYLIKSVH